MRVDKTSTGYMVWLMPEEQKRAEIIDAIKRLKETDRVVVFISGCEDVQQIIQKLINKRAMNI